MPQHIYYISDLGGADSVAEVEARIGVCAPADDDDAQGGTPEHGPS